MLTIIGVGVAISAVVSLVGIATGFESNFYDLYQQRGVDMVVLRASTGQRLSSSIDWDLGEKISRIPGVENVTGGLVDVVAFEDLALFSVPVNGWDTGAFLWDEITIIDGVRLYAGDQGKIILGKVLASNMGKKVGDKVILYAEEEFEVVGIFESFNVFENGSIVILLDELQRLTGKTNQVTGFTVSAVDAQIPEIRKAVRELEQGIDAIPTEDYAKSTVQIQASKSVAWLISTVGLVIGAIGILNTMAMSVFERTVEIGILRAIGWSKSRIIKMIVLESVLLSLAGAVVGVLGGVVMTKALAYMPFTSGFVDGNVAPHVMLWGFGIAFLVGVLGALYPASKGASLLPTEAFRQQ